MASYELLTEVRFSFKDSGIVEFTEAMDFVDEFIVAGINKLNKLYSVTYEFGSESDNSFACGYKLFVVIKGLSDVYGVDENDGAYDDAFYDFIERELLTEISDVFGGSSNDDFTYDLIRASETYGVSYYNQD